MEAPGDIKKTLRAFDVCPATDGLVCPQMNTARRHRH